MRVQGTFKGKERAFPAAGRGGPVRFGKEVRVGGPPGSAGYGIGDRFMGWLVIVVRRPIIRRRMPFGDGQHGERAGKAAWFDGSDRLHRDNKFMAA